MPNIRNKENCSVHADDDLYRQAIAQYSSSFMSNAKWLKLFRGIIQAEIHIERAEWRFIGSSHSTWQSFPSENDLFPTRFADGKFQPFEYRWLESIYIPERYRPISNVGYERQQDILAVTTALANAGQFRLDESMHGIIIHGYLR